MKRDVTTRGIVLARYPAGESSVRAVILTEDLGIIRALAKSARKEQSKLRPHLVSGTVGTFTFVYGKLGWRVIGATSTRNAHFETNDTAVRRSIAHITTVILALVHGEETNRALYLAVKAFTDAPSDPSAESICLTEVLVALGYASTGAVSARELSELERAQLITAGLAATGL